jgi:hypothetical protein
MAATDAAKAASSDTLGVPDKLIYNNASAYNLDHVSEVVVKENEARAGGAQDGPGSGLISISSLEFHKWEDRDRDLSPFYLDRDKNFRLSGRYRNTAFSFERMFPEVAKVVTTPYFYGLVAAGDTVSHAFRTNTSGPLPDLVDLYIVADSVDKAEEIRSRASHVLSCYFTDSGAAIISFHDAVGSATTIGAMWTAGRAPVKVRINRRVYPSVISVLNGFAIPTVAFTWKGEYMTSPLGAFMINTGIIYVRSECLGDAPMDTSYERQLKKCYQLGWAIGLPHATCNDDATRPSTSMTARLYNALTDACATHRTITSIHPHMRIIATDSHTDMDNVSDDGARLGGNDIFDATLYDVSRENLYQLLDGSHHWTSYSTKSRRVEHSEWMKERMEVVRIYLPILWKTSPTHTVADYFPRSAFDRALREHVDTVILWHHRYDDDDGLACQVINCENPPTVPVNTAYLNDDTPTMMHINIFALRRLGLTETQIARFIHEADARHALAGRAGSFTAELALQPFLDRARALYEAVAPTQVELWSVGARRQAAADQTVATATGRALRYTSDDSAGALATLGDQLVQRGASAAPGWVVLGAPSG